MKEKNKSANWYIAATHYLTAGFAIPIVLTIIIGFPLALLLGDDMLMSIASLVVGPVIIWLSVMYASNYVNKTYIINDSQKVINLATIYMVVITGGFQVFSFLAHETIDTLLVLDSIEVILMIGVFYMASKKYIHNTESETPQVSEENPVTV